MVLGRFWFSYVDIFEAAVSGGGVLDCTLLSDFNQRHCKRRGHVTEVPR